MAICAAVGSFCSITANERTVIGVLRVWTLWSSMQSLQYDLS